MLSGKLKGIKKKVLVPVLPSLTIVLMVKKVNVMLLSFLGGQMYAINFFSLNHT